MVCDGPNWCLADCMLRNYFQTLSKTAKTGVIKYFVTDRHLLRDRQTFLKLFKLPVFPLSQVEHAFCFALSVLFLCIIIAIWCKKSHDMFFFSNSNLFVAFRSCGR